jgi:ketosteroid isomerase-like protein
MQKGDDAFNARDFAAMDEVHHRDMVAYIPGNAEPICGREAHSAAMERMFRIFPGIQVHTPYSIQFGSGDWITVVTNVTGTFVPVVSDMDSIRSGYRISARGATS